MSSAEPRSPLSGEVWSRAEPPPLNRSPQETPLTRFLGGSPGAVLIRLIVMSFLVGALLMWLDVRPLDVILGFERFVRRVWDMGFQAIRDMADYVVAGALIVVPIWAITRLLGLRSLC